MKYLSLIFLLGLSSSIALSQDFEINVLDKSAQPMPYAFILLNGKPITVSDTLGKAFIRIDKLIEGDTISISYLGTRPTNVIFNDSLKLSRKHNFYLDESVYMLNEVEVNYFDVEKLFNKSIRDFPVLFFNCKMMGDFLYNFSYEKTRYSKQISGSLVATNDTRYEPRRWGWFDPPIEFLTVDDTNKFAKTLNFNVHNALWLANLSARLWQRKNKSAKPFYSYLGEKDSLKVFRVSYPKSIFQKFYYQIVLYTDKETKYLKHVEIDAYNDEPIEPPSNNYQYRFIIKYDCDLYTHKKPKRPAIYLPINIDYTFQTIDYSIVKLTLSHIKIKI